MCIKSCTSREGRQCRPEGSFPRAACDAVKINYSNECLIWCWKRANVDGLLQPIVSEDWHCVLECDKVETALIRWRAKVLQLTTNFVPNRRVRSSITSRPWLGSLS